MSKGTLNNATKWSRTRAAVVLLLSFIAATSACDKFHIYVDSPITCDGDCGIAPIRYTHKDGKWDCFMGCLGLSLDFSSREAAKQAVQKAKQARQQAIEFEQEETQKRDDAISVLGHRAGVLFYSKNKTPLQKIPEGWKAHVYSEVDVQQEVQKHQERSSKREISKGDKVESEDTNGKWWPGTVVDVNADSTYRVKLDYPHQDVVFKHVGSKSIMRKSSFSKQDLRSHIGKTVYHHAEAGVTQWARPLISGTPTEVYYNLLTDALEQQTAAGSSTDGACSVTAMKAAPSAPPADAWEPELEVDETQATSGIQHTIPGSYTQRLL